MAEPSEPSAQNQESESFYGVKLTGVPRDTTESDVRQFFNECNPSEIIICDGGNVYVQLNSQQEFEKACIKDGHQLRWTKVGVLTITTKEDYAAGVASSSVDNQGNHEEANKEDESQYNVIRLRGLPYSATATDVIGFLKGVSVDNGEKGVHFSSGSYGRSTGEVFVEVCSPEDVNISMKYDREHMGGRYIEIFRSSRAQLEWECRGAEKTGGPGGVVRLRGLPYGCSAADIRDFMQGIDISENGITVQIDDTGKETGEAFIELETDRDVERALDRHKKSIGHRYIEVFRTTRGDIKAVSNRWATYSRPSPYPTRGRGHDGSRGSRYGGRGRGTESAYGYGYDESYYTGHQAGGTRPGGVTTYPTLKSSSEPASGSTGGKHAVRMRGLPFTVTVRDIQNFFSPLIPINIVIEKNEVGRLSGEGEVSFGSHEDAVEGMRKDRTHIGSRYIELFLHSTSEYDPSQQTTWSGDASYAAYTNQDPRGQTQYTPQMYTTQQYGGGRQQQTAYAAQPQANTTYTAQYPNAATSGYGYGTPTETGNTTGSWY